MRRVSLVLGLTSSAVALVALVYSIGSHRSASRGEASQVHQAASADTNPDTSTVVAPQRPENDSQKGDEYENPVVEEARRNISHDDEATDRKMVREERTRDVANWYSLLLKHLDVPPREKDALISFLIEDLIARTSTRYSPAIGMDEQERSSRIAAIIGDAKLQQFLALERNRREYAEVQKMGSIFQQHGVALSDTKQDGLLEILVEVREQDKTVPGADAERASIEYLEYRLAQIDEYERLVLEQAQSVLSPKQVEYMFERYQHNSYRRADALEAQKQARADNPDEKLRLWYPAPNN